MSLELASEYLYVESGGPDDEDQYEEGSNNHIFVVKINFFKEEAKESIIATHKARAIENDDGETCLFDILGKDFTCTTFDK
jgi:hypothetical protein